MDYPLLNWFFADYFFCGQKWFSVECECCRARFASTDYDETYNWTIEHWNVIHD